MNGALDWRPRGGVRVAERRASIIASARRYFEEQKVLEIDAPAVSRRAVSDPNIDSMAVVVKRTDDGNRFLHSSPEFAMKRMLADGFPDIYFIGKVYREGEAGRRHQPEFTMIEWYRLAFKLPEIIDDCESLLQVLLGGGRLNGPTDRISYTEAFERHLNVDPLGTSIDRLADLAGADEMLAKSLGDNRDGWLDLLLATRVSSRFPTDRLTVLHHYPSSQAALARLDPDDDRFAERFEVFLGDIELANGYVELTNAKEQRQRMEAEQQARRRCGKQVPDIDERFLAALEAGLPDCSGVALGLDRVLMLALDTDDIRDVRHFDWETA